MRKGHVPLLPFSSSEQQDGRGRRRGESAGADGAVVLATAAPSAAWITGRRRRFQALIENALGVSLEAEGETEASGSLLVELPELRGAVAPYRVAGRRSRVSSSSTGFQAAAGPHSHLAGTARSVVHKWPVRRPQRRRGIAEAEGTRAEDQTAGAPEPAPARRKRRGTAERHELRPEGSSAVAVPSHRPSKRPRKDGRTLTADERFEEDLAALDAAGPPSAPPAIAPASHSPPPQVRDAPLLDAGASAGDGDALASLLLPCDTELALRAARDSFPQDAFRWTLPPVLLRSQVYAVIHDKSLADRELRELTQKNVIKQFALPSTIDTFALSRRGTAAGGVDGGEWIGHHAAGSRRKVAGSHASGAHGDDYLVMFAEDYVVLVERQRQAFLDAPAELVRSGSGERAKVSSADDVISRFRNQVLPNWHDVCISLEKLDQLLCARNEVGSGDDEDVPRQARRAKAEEEMTTLVRSGLLLMPTSTAGNEKSGQLLWFAIPGVGSYVQSLLAGRTEIVEMLKRERTGQILESRLLHRKLRGSSLGMEYHIRDACELKKIEKIGSAGPDHCIVRLATRNS
jgi:Serine-threonine protein kinase 19